MKKATAKNITGVLLNLSNNIDNGLIDAKEFANILNEWLDELVSQDFFGTEGQLDPRGDHRDNDL